MAAGGLYFAWIHDRTGTYDVAISTAGVLMILSGLLMMTLSAPRGPVSTDAADGSHETFEEGVA